MIKVDVIVCTYNRAESLKATLDALSEQIIDRSIEFNVLVVDNNSQDQTKRVFEDCASHSRHKMHYVFESKQGLSNARNAGVEASRADIILFTDDDVIPEPNWVVELSSVFSDRDVEVAGSRILPIWHSPPPRWLTEDLWGYLALLDLGNQFVDLEKDTIWGASMGFRRETLISVGLFNPSLGRTKGKLFSGEESAVIRTIREQGGKVIYTPATTAHHKIEKERVAKRYFRRWALDDGELQGILFECTNGRKFLEVPLHRYRKLLTQTLIYVSRVLVRNKHAFPAQLKLLRTWGFISSRITNRKLPRKKGP